MRIDRACQTNSGGSSGAAADAFPVTVEHLYGSTEIAAEPTRIATVSWVNADTALALDIVPVGLPLVEWGGNDNQSTDWIDAKEVPLAEGPFHFDDYVDYFWLVKPKAASIESLVDGLRRAA